jgi:hypothetical protein
MVSRRVSPLRPPVKRASSDVKMHPVESSFIAAIGHDAATDRIHVHFVDGGKYDYPGTTKDLEAWRASIGGGHSAGRFFHANIRGREFNRREAA